jgi:invasion protein IalB
VALRANKEEILVMTVCMPAPAQAARLSLVATIAGAALAAFTVSTALAQQPAQRPAQPQPPKPTAQAPKPPAPPKPAAQQQPPQQQRPPQQQQQQAQGEQPQLIYSPWTKFCLKGQDANAKEVCFTGKDARIESGMPVVAAVLIEPQGEQKKLLRVTLPLGMLVQPGTRVIIDQNEPMNGPYVICFTNGCMADYEVSADMLGRLKKGQQLTVQAINGASQPISLPLPLTDFAKAYDGPPTDPKELEAQQKKLQEQLQERAEKARKELESRQSQQGQPPGKTQ